ncbi:MAG: hypothetical protein R3D33_06085 [Hyphomicrobiaceae bacterium]
MIVLIGTAVTLALGLLIAVLWPREPKRPTATPETLPDRPASFGYRTSWLAIRTRDTRRVVEALGLSEVEESGWTAGIEAVYVEPRANSHVFVSPPVSGWTFVVGLALPHPVGTRFADTCTPLLMDLGRQFIEVQYFFTFPEMDFYAWARVIDGKLSRAFAWGDEGIIWNSGRVTKEEKLLGLRILEPRATDAPQVGFGESGTYPTEDHVVDLAGRWSLDPTTLDTIEGPLAVAFGYLGRTPAHWRMRRAQPRKAGRPAARPAVCEPHLETPSPEPRVETVAAVSQDDPPGRPPRGSRPYLRPVT